MRARTEANKIRQIAGPQLSRIELINQARRLACQHVENARIPAECILRALRIPTPELAIRTLTLDMLHEASVELLTEGT